MKFTYNPRIIRHLGTELITTDEIAITELIKNSYDAGANKVNIQFIDDLSNLDDRLLECPIPDVVTEEITKNDGYGIIVLEDNGCGMDKSTLERGFFEVGSVEKYNKKQEQKQKNNPNQEDENIILGDKGIGRLSAQRLSPILFVETTSAEDDIIHLVRVDWYDFITNENADAPVWEIPKAQTTSYTRLWFISTEEKPMDSKKYVVSKELTQPDIFGNPPETIESALFVTGELQSALSFLYSPFEERNVLIDLKIARNKERVRLDFSYDTLKISESIHSFDTELIYDEEGSFKDLQFKLNMKVMPWFLERIHYGELGKHMFAEQRKEHAAYRQLYEKYKSNYETSLSDTFLLSEIIEKRGWPKKYNKLLLAIAPMKGKIYSFKRDNFLLRLAVDSSLENGYLQEDASINTAIRPFLEEHNGIKLYRNNFRIATIGNRDNDWLQLQQKRTSGQQFYRFELGNVIGFIKINDKYQEYIYETSSREYLTDTGHAKALQKILDHILDIFSPLFTRRAVEITKSILDQEGWIVKNDTEEIQRKTDHSQEVLNAAQQNIKALQKAFEVIKNNLDLDTDAKRDSVRTVLQGLQPIAEGFNQNIEDTQKSFENATRALQIAKSQQERIETDTYNNYKIMANGLITEVITHELHSMLGDKDKEEEFEHHFEALKSFLFEVKNYELNKEHLEPVHKRFQFLHGKMQDLNQFYSFIERTFVYQGTIDELEATDLKGFLKGLEVRFSSRLNRAKIQLDYSSVSSIWNVPKGSMMHLFYNLIDNSIYWIKERQKRSSHDVSLRRESDNIIIRTIDDQTVHFYDTGVGVMEKMQQSLFLPLESGKENGRGMGLYIVRNFLKSFGAEIELLPNKNEYGNPYIFEIRVKQNNLEEDE